jgi:flagellar biosynthesis protein FlhB
MADKTEAPTPHRLADARRKGQVVKSMELNAAIALIVGAWLLQGPGSQLVQGINGIIRESITHIVVPDITITWLKEMAFRNISLIFFPLVAIALTMMIVGTAVTLLQTRFSWASERKTFDFSRVNPISGLKRMFSVRGLFELLKSLLKLVVIGWVAYTTLKNNATQMLSLAQMDLGSGIGTYVQLISTLIWRVAGAYFILAIADYLYQRWDFMKNMRMTRQEVLDEYKQTEGDPLLRGRIRDQQRRAARQRMMSQVPKADVIITNPTHLAVAIQYDSKNMLAPRVLAKGAQLLAQRIVDVARKNDVPVIQNIPLARAMYKLVEIDQEIPPDLYKAMAEVLAYVYKMKSKGMPAKMIVAEM